MDKVREYIRDSKTMTNLDQFKLPDKAATMTLSQIVINHNDMALRVNPKLYG